MVIQLFILLNEGILYKVEKNLDKYYGAAAMLSAVSSQ